MEESSRLLYISFFMYFTHCLYVELTATLFAGNGTMRQVQSLLKIMEQDLVTGSNFTLLGFLFIECAVDYHFIFQQKFFLITCN